MWQAERRVYHIYISTPHSWPFLWSHKYWELHYSYHYLLRWVGAQLLERSDLALLPFKITEFQTWYKANSDNTIAFQGWKIVWAELILRFKFTLRLVLHFKWQRHLKLEISVLAALDIHKDKCSNDAAALTCNLASHTKHIHFKYMAALETLPYSSTDFFCEAAALFIPSLETVGTATVKLSHF